VPEKSECVPSSRRMRGRHRRGRSDWPDNREPSRVGGGLRVALFERNRSLPRATAYDAETLRLFAQAGLFDEIVPGLMENPSVRYFNVRGKTLAIAPRAWLTTSAPSPRTVYRFSRSPGSRMRSSAPSGSGASAVNETSSSSVGLGEQLVSDRLVLGAERRQ
jgi:hypothetical protein